MVVLAVDGGTVETGRVAAGVEVNIFTFSKSATEETLFNWLQYEKDVLDFSEQRASTHKFAQLCMNMFCYSAYIEF